MSKQQKPYPVEVKDRSQQYVVSKKRDPQLAPKEQALSAGVAATSFADDLTTTEVERAVKKIRDQQQSSKGKQSKTPPQ